VKYFVIILTVVTAMASFSCDSSGDEKITDYDFFPLKTGWYQIYNIEEIRYELGEPDTFRYEIKTVVTDSFANSQGAVTYVLHRSKLDTWSAESNARELIVSEENIPYVKLKFPATSGRSWDGNAYNNVVIPSSNQHEDLYKIKEQGNSLMLGDLEFGEFVTVEQEDNQEFIVYFDKRTEIYARHVGLVFREIIQLEYCTATDCLGDQIVETGIIFKQTITAYGEE
jgi:hypothetical protein